MALSPKQFFEHTLKAKLTNSSWSWGAIDDQGRVFLRVWADEFETHDGHQYVVVLREPRQSSNGYRERERQIAAMAGGNGFGVILTPNVKKDGSRSIREFDKATLLRLGPILKLPNRALARIDGRISVAEAISIPIESTLADDLEEIKHQPNASPTTIKALVDARLGQGKFRKDVLSLWANRCAVCGSKTERAIRASHIKPWRHSTNEERLDPNNGLPLVATLDALFDAGLISFDEAGAILISPNLSPTEQDIFALTGKSLLKKPSKATAKYLDHHRAEIFK